MTKRSQDPVRLRLRLPDLWRPFDWENPVPEGTDPDIANSLRRSGLLTPPPRSVEAELVLAAHMVELPGEGFENEPPLVATLAVTQTRRATPVEVTRSPDGDVVPDRATRRSAVDWPDVGRIEFHHVRYVVPSPDGHVLYGMDFATPNLPLVELLEAMFDAIVGAATFVEEPLAEA